MNLLRFLLGVVVSTAFFPVVQAQPSGKSGSGGKSAAKGSPADIAAEKFFKLRQDKTAEANTARYLAVLEAGFAYLVEYPTHKNADAVVNGLGTFGMTMRQKGQAANRASFMARLKYEVLNYRLKEGLSDDARAAVAAVEASAAGMEAREAFNRDTLGTFREKIDALALMPRAARFLPTQEMEYVDVLRGSKSGAAEAHLKALTQHADKKLAEMATEQLKFTEATNQPYALKFTALDGRPVDFEQLRGKVVLLSFWSATNQKTHGEQAALRQIYGKYKKQNFEIVGVACDKESDRAAVTKYVKDNKVEWPQHFDGNGVQTDFIRTLGVRSVPNALLFDRKGMLVATEVRAENLEPGLKKMLGVK